MTDVAAPLRSGLTDKNASISPSPSSPLASLGKPPPSTPPRSSVSLPESSSVVSTAKEVKEDGQPAQDGLKTPTLRPALSSSHLQASPSRPLPTSTRESGALVGLGLASSNGGSSAELRGGTQSQLLPARAGQPSARGSAARPPPTSSRNAASASTTPTPPSVPSFGIGRMPSGGGLFIGKSSAWSEADQGRDGQWRVNVASDEGAGVERKGRKVCVYAQSATHNFTLLRTIKEIKETHDKLAAAHVSPSLPPFPQPALQLLDPSTVSAQAPAPPPARKSSIRRAFSRLRESSRDRAASASAAGSGQTTPSLLSPPRSPKAPAMNLGVAGVGAGLGAGGRDGSTPTIEEEDPLDAGAAADRTQKSLLPPVPNISPLLPPSGDSPTTSPAPGAQSATQQRVSSSSSSHDSPLTSDAERLSGAEGEGKENDLPTPLAALSTLLTALANDQAVRESKAWKRFLRVRGDDMSSVRVERKVIRTASAQGLSQAAGGLSSSIKGLGRSLRSNSKSSDSSNFNELTSQGVLVDKTEGKQPAILEAGEQVPGACEELSVGEPSMTGKGDPPHTPPGSSTPVPCGPLTPSVPMLPMSPSTAVHSPPFPEDEGRIPTPSPSLPSVSSQASPQPPSAGTIALPDSLLTPGDVVFPSPPAPATRVRTRRKVGIEDFELIRVLGKGCAGKVLLVKKKERKGRETKDGSGGPLLALKSIVKRHVLAHQELQHTLTEQAVLRRMSRDIKNPFVVHLHYSFHDKENLFLVMDFHPGGDLATQLARWGRFGRDRARFYAAEIVEGVQGLHAAGVIYRDLKPENILLDAAGHLVLTDFGLSKEFPRQAFSSPPIALSNGEVSGFDLDPEPTTPQYMQPIASSDEALTDQQWLDWAPSGDRLRDVTETFCGTAEYLAPEVIQGLSYSYGVDWWSFGTLLWEMLVGSTPFMAANHSDMYLRVLHEDLVFPEDRPMDQDTKSLLRGLLQKDPALRIGEPRIKRHPYFSLISWDHIYHKRYIPPYAPPIDPDNAMDTSNFDALFLEMDPTINGDAGGEGLAAAPTSAAAAAAADMEDRASLWGGYSYRERDAASIFTLDTEQGSYGRKSGELLRESIDSAQLAHEQHQQSPLPHDEDTSRLAGAHDTTDEKAASHDGPLDPVDRPPPEASTSGSSLEDSVDEPPLSPISVHAGIGRTGIASVDRNRAFDSEAEPDIDNDGDGDASDEDDDWDVIEKPRAGLQDENGAKGATFFARGVVDRYRFGQLKKKESRSVLAMGHTQEPTPNSSPVPSVAQTTKRPPPTSFAARRGLTFKGGRFRRKVSADVQQLGNLQTSSSAAALKNSDSTPSSLSQSVLGTPATSPSLPSSLSSATDGNVSAAGAAAARSSSVSPTKTSSRLASAMSSEDDGAGSGNAALRISSGEKLKLFGRSGQEKVLNLFKG